MIWVFMPMIAWLLSMFFAGLFGEVIPPIDGLLVSEFLVILQVCYIVLIFVKVKKTFFRKESLDSED